MTMRARRPTVEDLPAGYQFGHRHDFRLRWSIEHDGIHWTGFGAVCACGADAGPVDTSRLETIYGYGRWRSPSEKAAEQLNRKEERDA